MRSAPAPHDLDIALPLPDEFDLPLIVRHLRSSSFGLPYGVVQVDHIFRGIVLGGGTHLVEIRIDGGTPEQGAMLRAHLHGAARAAERACAGTELAERLRNVLALKHDLAACWRVLGADPAMRPLAESLRGLRLVQGQDVFEALFIVILGQQISVKAALSQRRRVVEALGERHDHGQRRFFSVPRPEALADTPPERLHALGISRQKSHYLRAAAAWAQQGKLERSVFDGLNDKAAIDYLRGIPGVGRWTAEIVLARGLSRLDIFPAGDIGLQQAVQTLLSLPRRPPQEELREIAERWRGWRSYAALYLWSSSLATRNRLAPHLQCLLPRGKG